MKRWDDRFIESGHTCHPTRGKECTHTKVINTS
jgi:hypothetical protein